MSESTFWFEVELGQVAVPSKHQSNFALPSEFRVLVVSSNPNTRKVIAAPLEHWGCKVVQANTYRSSNAPFNLLILDSSQLPEFDESHREVPVVLLTSLFRNAPECANVTTLAKPVRQHHLQSILAQLANTSRPLSEILRQPSHPSTNLGLKILVAEDNQVNTLILQRYLHALSCEYVCVENGASAVEQATAHHFDMILMDLQMPQMDGFEATRKLRSIEDGDISRTPIIALTAHAQSGDRERCLAAGMDDYLSKPINRQDLEAKLKYWGESGESVQRAAA